MNPSGYSGKLLIVKLGYQAGEIICVVDAPKDFTRYLAEEGVSLSDKLPAAWAHGFFTERASLEAFLSETDLTSIEKGLWVSWPKQTARVPTNLTEQTFRDLILPLGWVDTKVAAIDETWSGLKFLRRKPSS